MGTRGSSKQPREFGFCKCFSCQTPSISKSKSGPEEEVKLLENSDEILSSFRAQNQLIGLKLDFQQDQVQCNANNNYYLS